MYHIDDNPRARVYFSSLLGNSLRRDGRPNYGVEEFGGLVCVVPDSMRSRKTRSCIQYVAECCNGSR